MHKRLPTTWPPKTAHCAVPKEWKFGALFWGCKILFHKQPSLSYNSFRRSEIEVISFNLHLKIESNINEEHIFGAEGVKMRCTSELPVWIFLYLVFLHQNICYIWFWSKYSFLGKNGVKYLVKKSNSFKTSFNHIWGTYQV